MVYLDLLKGDCLKVMKDISSNTVDCFICDLPYGCLASGWHSRPVKRLSDGKDTPAGNCSWDVKINLEELWTEIERLSKSPNTPILMFCTARFGYELIQSKPKWFRYDLIWDKQRGVSFLRAGIAPLQAHESIYVFSKAGAYYNRIDEDDPGKKEHTYNKGGYDQNTYKNSSNAYLPGSGVLKSHMPEGKRCSISLLRHKKVMTKGGHPTEKPMALYKWLIERYCPPGGTVLDPTAGSFNSCFAAYELNRNAIGIEMNDEFYNKACERADQLN